MKKTFNYILLIFLILTFFVQCAKRGTPSGGPEDITPPEVIRATPENYSTNFDSDEIRIYFDEYIKLKNAQQQIIISPPMNPRPQITPLGMASKYVEIKINDTLKENTTYVINFGRSIIDNNAENATPFFKYVFSTGDEIDSLQIKGSIKDAFLKDPENFVSVMLYEVDSSYTDSAVFKYPPRYITNTLDSASTFEISNLRAGTYQLIALKDKNNNYKFDPDNEKIAFANEYISVPNDSIFSLNLFEEEPDFNFKRPSQNTEQHVLFGYEGSLEDFEINLINPTTPDSFTATVYKDPITDTLHYFYKPKIEADTLLFKVAQADYIDTLLLRRGKELSRDSLSLKLEPSGGLSFRDSLKLTANIPIEIADEDKFSILDKDSVAIPFETEFLKFKNEVFFNFKKEENQVYYFKALPGAIEGFFGTVNDTISKSFRTKAYSDYGNLWVTLQNVPDIPVIVQVTNKKGNVVAEEAGLGKSNFNFNHLNSGEYYLRVIFDENNNGRWDTGNFLQKLQPEHVIYFPEILDVRANWDVSQTFTLK